MYNPRDMEDHITFCPQTNRMLDRGVEGEIRAVRYLYENLSVQSVGNYRVLVNYNFPRRGTNTLEIDLLVITTFGVFLLEVKNWVGMIKAYDDAWFFNGKKRDNIFGTASFKAKSIRTYLRDSHISSLSFDAKKISVTSLIVLIRGTQKFQNLSHYDNRAVVSLDLPLIHALSSIDLLWRPERSQRLSDQDIELVSNAFFLCHQSEKDEIVGDYRLLKKVRSADLFEEFEAENIHVTTQRVRLKSYHLHTFVNERVTENTIEHFKRDLEVVNSLGYHPNIVWTTHFFPDPKYYDLYYEVTEPIDGKRLDELMEQRYEENRSLPFQEQLIILNALCRALQHTHSHLPEAVYHRNISSDTVFLTRDNRASEAVVKLADFDFAKFGKHTINPIHLGADYQNKVLIDKVFTAPEVLRDASEARAYSDIYSLGVLWYFLAQLPVYNPIPHFDPSIDADTIDKLELPEEARVLLKRMVAYEIDRRPQRIEEVINELSQMNIEKF